MGWSELGQPYDLLWRITLREYDLIVRGVLRARENDVKVRRVLQQEMASLMSFAHHKPDKMPDFTKAGPAPAPAINSERANEQLRARLIMLHFHHRKN